jgi:ABC-type nickel/cobalt efflux system permease component RcnA
MEPRSVYWDCDLSFCNLLSETSNFAVGAFLLLCLVSRLQQPTSSGFKQWASYRSFTLLQSLPDLMDYRAKRNENWFICLPALSERTHASIISKFQFKHAHACARTHACTHTHTHKSLTDNFWIVGIRWLTLWRFCERAGKLMLF